jgi:osmotically-inducible protein OsmY
MAPTDKAERASYRSAFRPAQLPAKDTRLQDRVTHELLRDPRVRSADIAAIVKDGAVTLSGRVSSDEERLAALEVAEGVYGVKSVADQLEVTTQERVVPDDAQLAAALARSLRSNLLVPDSVVAEVRDGDVTLRGNVRWPFQRWVAQRAIRGVRGIRSMSNEIDVNPNTARDHRRTRRGSQ